MAEGTRSGNRQRRSDAREQRRGLAAKPFEALDEAAGAQQGGGARSTLKQAAATAVAGALAAGVAGAAKALADRREEPRPKQREPDPEPGEQPDAEPQAQVEDDEPDERDDAQHDEPDERDDAQPQAAAEQEQEHEQEQEDEPDEQPEERADDSEQPPRGASTNDAKEIVAEAKRELQELLGAEVESVSGFHRSDGRWTVTLEVVNVRRIPDTTDVLSSYEVAFDDDRNLVSVTETRRYRRSQVEEGR